MIEINSETRLCAIIGNPVGHSLSPVMHNAAFEAVGLNYAYVAFCVEDVGACLSGMRALPSFRGLSVTIPHKVAVIQYLDEVSAMVERVGSVNTVTNESGRLIGTVTDGVGTLEAFRAAGAALTGKRVLLVGSGGAVRAVAFAMVEEVKPALLTILGRSRGRLDSLVADLRAHTEIPIESGFIVPDAAAAMDCHDIIIQGTAVGMYGHDEGRSCVPAEQLRSEHVVFDMVYRPLRTKLIEDAEAAGCTTILGLEMLVNQAALQFETWTGRDAPREVMRAALVEELGGKRASTQPKAEEGV